MTARIDSAGPSLTEEDLVRLEQDLRASLPSDYRSFLLKSNGGVPTPFLIDIPGAPGSPTDVQVFFGIGRSVESSDLLWNKRTFEDRLPQHMLPIACDSGGNLLCLVLSGPDERAIVYADVEAEKPAFYRVAGGFAAMLGMLRRR